MKKIFRFGGIRSRLILLLLVVLVPILLIEVFIYHRTVETRRSEALEGNLEVARAVAMNFSTFVNDLIHSELAIGLALTASQPISGGDRNRILDNFQVDNPTVRSVFWVNPSGLIVASSLRSYIGFDVSDRSFVKEIIAGRNWIVSELILGKATGKLAFTIGRGIRNEQGKLLGIVAASIEPDRMNSVLGLARSSGAAVSLIDNKGIQVYRYPDLGYNMEQRNILKLYPIIGGSLKGENVLANITSVSTGERRLVAYTPVPTVGWVASAGRAENEVMSKFIKTMRFQSGLIILVTLLGSITALALSRRISNAVIRLRNESRALARGESANFDIASGPDEVKDLALALNLMAGEVQLREKQLIDANKELESFAYSVSHDLKAPLRAIEGFSRMLIKKYKDHVGEDAERMLGVIRSNADKMGVLIDDLLSFSRVLKDGTSPSMIEMDKLVGEVCEDIKPEIQEREIEFKITNIISGYADRALIKQVFFNLISNAVKFTVNRKAGVIEISSYTEPGFVVYCVKDNGAGFDMAHSYKLFGIFQRLHSDEEYAGTGVGLAIVQRIVKRHGGRVWAKGAVDKGATFYFALPTQQG
jgi:signal transduction histidine kinase